MSVFALLSYPFVFVNWAITRDFPWASLLMFAVAIVLLFAGIRRAFTPGRRRLSKIISSVLATLSVLILGLFVFVAFIESRWLPPSRGAPQVGQKAPDFTLADTNNTPVLLSDLLSSTIRGKAPNGVLLIFYRGFW